MSKLFPTEMTNQNGNVFIILLIAIVLLGATGGLLYLNQNPTLNPFNRPTGVDIPQNQAELIQRQITLDYLNEAQITEQNLQNSANLLNKRILPDGSTEYTVKSKFASRDNILIIKDKVFLFKREITINDKLIHPKLTDYLKTYGNPDKILTGSKFFGPYQKFYLYPAKGFVLSANPGTDEIDEIYSFVPTTEENFLQKWGEDYFPNP